MSRTRTTNILLVFVLVALVANVFVTLARPPAAFAVDKGQRRQGVAVEAQQVSERVAMDRVLGDIAPAVREMAAGNRAVAEAIREHARATRDIARAIQAAARQSEPRK